MNEFTNKNEKLTDYLLGRLSPPELDGFEDRLFADDELGASLDHAENDLIDEYVRGEMPAAEKAIFEANFLATDRGRGKVRAARILDTHLFTSRPAAFVQEPATTGWFERLSLILSPQRFAWAAAAAAILLIALFGGLWLMVRDPGPQVAGYDANDQAPPEHIIEPGTNKVADPNAIIPANDVKDNVNASHVDNEGRKNLPASDNRSPEERTNPKNTRTVPAPLVAPRVFALTLFPVTRGSENPSAVIASNAENVLIRVVHTHDAKYVRYRVELRNSSGDVIWSRQMPAAKRTANSFSLKLPGQILSQDTYELALIGITRDGQFEETNFYNFSIKRK